MSNRLNSTKNLSVFLLALMPSLLSAKINVVTTTADLAAIAAEVGGDWVQVESIVKGYQDPHMVDAKPSYLLKLKKADLYIQIGLELEVGWAPALLSNARNKKILPGNAGFLDVSEGIRVLEKPTGVIDRSAGDIHPFGNPHYWLDSQNGLMIATRIAKKYMEMDPPRKVQYEKNLGDFEERLKGKEKEWAELGSPLKGLKVVAYHNTWPYLMERYGIDVISTIESKPGIPPAPAHVASLIQQVRSEKVAVILVDPYFDHKLPEKIARDTGAKVIQLAPSVGSVKEIRSYGDLFDYNLKLLNESVR